MLKTVHITHQDGSETVDKSDALGCTAAADEVMKRHGFAWTSRGGTVVKTFVPYEGQHDWRR